MPGSDLVDPTSSARLHSTTAWPSPAPRRRLAKVWILESSTPLPHMDSRSPEFTALHTHTHNTPHVTLLFCGLHATDRSTSLASREIGFDSGFWFLGGLRLGPPQRPALPPGRN